MTRHPFLAKWALWLLPAFFLVFAGAQLQVAAQLADPAGLTLMEAVHLWIVGVEPGGAYSGLLLAAIVRVERALGMFCVGLAFAGFAAAATVLRGRERRLYAACSIRGEEESNA